MQQASPAANFQTRPPSRPQCPPETTLSLPELPPFFDVSEGLREACSFASTISRYRYQIPAGIAVCTIYYLSLWSVSLTPAVISLRVCSLGAAGRGHILGEDHHGTFVGFIHSLTQVVAARWRHRGADGSGGRRIRAGSWWGEPALGDEHVCGHRSEAGWAAPCFLCSQVLLDVH